MGQLKPNGIVKAQLKQANIAEDYWEIDFGSYEGPQQAARWAMEYLQNLRKYREEGIGILFAGKPGTGKTSLAAIVLKYLTRYGWNCYMTSLSEIVEEIKRSWDSNDTSFIDTCKEVDFLFIDDLGKEHQGPSGFSATTFDNLLRYRVQHRLPTIFTTNLTRSQIKERYGEALLSLVEGKCKVIEVSGQDYRSTTQKNQLING